MAFLALFFFSACGFRNSITDENRSITEDSKVTVFNNTEYSATVIDKKLLWGKWYKQPTSSIRNYATDYFSTSTGTTSGTEGYVEYSIYNGSFKINWDITFWGKITNTITVNDPHNEYDIICIGCGEPKTQLSVYVNQKNKPLNYNVIIMSDPQAWRLNTNGDPNKNKNEWESVNTKVANSINSLDFSKNFAFGIVNGDITEFGRMETRASFDAIYTKRINFPLLIGLGNHDYANNVNDCTEPSIANLSTNACARGAFFDLID